MNTPANAPNAIDARVSTLAQRPQELAVKYHQRDPRAASIHKVARTHADGNDSPLTGRVIPGDYGVAWDFGIDHAVGGDHRAPNPAEMLCAALAACEDATVRMLAERMDVALQSLHVEVDGEVDVRGCLGLPSDQPVGFDSMHCKIRMDAAPGTPGGAVARLQAAAQQACINLRTLREGVAVTLEFTAPSE